MKKRFVLLISVLLAACLAGCGTKETTPPAAGQQAQEVLVQDTAEDIEEKADCPLEEGLYTAEFDTDSGMFSVNETCDGMGVLTVAEGRMTIHVSLKSKKIVNLFAGLAEQAKAEDADWLQPTVDSVTYPDGLTEEVYGFDIPVPCLEQEFDVALIGTKGVWYDHKVSVKNPRPYLPETPDDGTYLTEVTLKGGSGRASVASPAELRVSEGKMQAEIVWSSDKYDYMLVEEQRYEPEYKDGHSVFWIPVSALGTEIAVQADTVAMSEPHLIEYTLLFQGAVSP